MDDDQGGKRDIEKLIGVPSAKLRSMAEWAEGDGGGGVTVVVRRERGAGLSGLR